MEHNFTKIIFTLGPATLDREVLKELLTRGVDICRLNMAHASHDWTREAIDLVRSIADEVGRDIAFMMDVKGPEIRTRDLPETWNLEKGSFLDLSIIKEMGKINADGVRQVAVNYPDFLDDIEVGQTILIDSGLLKMEVVSIDKTKARCKVITPGPLGNRRHVNLPGVKVKLPALTEKDREDIALGVEKDVEFYALSFVRESPDLDRLRELLCRSGTHARIIAKIEDQSAISNLESIVTSADGLMIARGDLGIEIPYETLPKVQREAAEMCLTQGKPFIVATHLLESMIENPMPTRAEITDIANAVHEQADCIMLSGETTVGKYPIECLDVMRRVSKATEPAFEAAHNHRIKLHIPKAKLMRSAVVMAEELGGAGIMAFTRSGSLARILASLRPTGCPIYAFTDVPRIAKHTRILWGVQPFLIEFSPDPEKTIQNAFDVLVKNDLAEVDDDMVIATSVLTEGHNVYTLQYRPVPWNAGI